MKNNSTIDYTKATTKFLWALTIFFSFNTSQSWGQYTGSGTFEKVISLGDLTDGYYVILNSGEQYAMNSAHTGSLFPSTYVSPSGNELVNPATNIVWEINTDGGGKTIQSVNTNRYASYSGSSNNIQAVTSVSANNQRWTFTYVSNEFTVTNLAVTNRRIRYNSSSPRFVCYSTTFGQNLVLYKLQSTPPPSTPTLTLSANTITNLNYNLNYGPATNQTFTTQGANLTANINLSAPPNFEISTSSTTGFASSLTLTPTAGTVNPTTIYTRLAANLGVGIYTGTLSATSSGAPAQNISLNGKVLPTLTSIGVAYTEDFSSYSSAATVPSGWSVVSSGGVNGYGGNWGTGTSGGQRGAGVLGYQHTASSGVVTKTLTLLNDIGATINQLEISYDGKVERATQGRSPEYTVTVNGTTISELAYSTASGVDESIIFTVTGLNILNGETVEIRWSSDRGQPSGASRQIGIDNVSIMVPNNTALPVELTTFNGVYNKHFSILNWETESEQNNDYFTLYHSTNGKSFEQIGRVSGSGTTSSLLSYTFEHREPRPGINYYKLTSTDYDGTLHDKGIIAVQVEMNHVFYDQITQSIQMNYTSDYAIYGSDGRLIARVANQNVIPFSGHGVFHVIDERSGKTFKLGVW